MAKEPMFTGKNQRSPNRMGGMYHDLAYKSPMGQMKSAARKAKRDSSALLKAEYNVRKAAAEASYKQKKRTEKKRKAK